MPKLSGSVRFVMYVGSAGYWRWELLTKNGKTVADSGNEYSSRAACRAAIVRVQRLVRLASVVVEAQ